MPVPADGQLLDGHQTRSPSGCSTHRAPRSTRPRGESRPAAGGLEHRPATCPKDQRARCGRDRRHVRPGQGRLLRVGQLGRHEPGQDNGRQRRLLRVPPFTAGGPVGAMSDAATAFGIPTKSKNKDASAAFLELPVQRRGAPDRHRQRLHADRRDYGVGTHASRPVPCWPMCLKAFNAVSAAGGQVPFVQNATAGNLQPGMDSGEPALPAGARAPPSSSRQRPGQVRVRAGSVDSGHEHCRRTYRP